jgi:hypothetical protein
MRRTGRGMKKNPDISKEKKTGNERRNEISKREKARGGE